MPAARCASVSPPPVSWRVGFLDIQGVIFCLEIRTEKKEKEIQRSERLDGEWKGPGRQGCSGPHSNGKNRNERRCFSRFCGLFV